MHSVGPCNAYDMDPSMPGSEVVPFGPFARVGADPSLFGPLLLPGS